ncbi:MAG: DUF4125 family protein [Solidesulfovibrio sp.]
MATQREAVLQAIIDVEQEMFCALNTGEDQNTEEKIKPFRLGRWMTFSVLSDEVLDSYLLDLIEARKDGRNLLTEKYALMAGQIPTMSEEPMIAEIVAVECGWMQDLAKKYPNTIKQTQENAEFFKKYASCELQTYSSNTLILLHRDVLSAQVHEINLAEKRYNNFYERIGHGSLQDMEATASNIA